MAAKKKIAKKKAKKATKRGRSTDALPSTEFISDSDRGKTFYCHTCGHLAAVLSESFVGRPPQHCAECASLREKGWLE